MVSFRNGIIIHSFIHTRLVGALTDIISIHPDFLFHINFGMHFQINITENRSVLHVALRAPRDKVICSDGKNVVPDVWKVLDKISEFSERVRSGSWVKK